jgi:hypothetical protein
MKRKFLLCVSMTVFGLFASCSSDETVDIPAGRTIEFSGDFVNNNTRAEYTTSNITKFNVYGWVSKKIDANTTQSGVIFNGDEVSKTNGKWTYTNTQYWIDGGTYNFSALAGYTSGNGTLTITNEKNARADKPTIKDFELNGGTEDLIYSDHPKAISYTYSANTTPEAVAFTFQHQLSKVKFSFVSTLGGLGIKVTDIKITDPFEKGTVELSNTQHGAVWTPETRPESGNKALDFGSAPTVDTDYVSTNSTTPSSTEPRFMIPAESKEGAAIDYTVTFTTTLYQGGIEFTQVEHKTTIKALTLEPGYAYNFIATLTKDNILGTDENNKDKELKPIEFDVTKVEDWATTTDQELANYEAPKTETNQGNSN